MEIVIPQSRAIAAKRIQLQKSIVVAERLSEQPCPPVADIRPLPVGPARRQLVNVNLLMSDVQWRPVATSEMGWYPWNYECGEVPFRKQASIGDEHSLRTQAI